MIVPLDLCALESKAKARAGFVTVILVIFSRRTPRPCQQGQELLLKVVVSLASITVQMLLHADVEREQNLVLKTLLE